MVKPKYYTPSMEEFHVGFEYEELHSGVWRRFMLINSAEDLEPLYDYEEECYRVKYLDQEDIESLGFEHKVGVNHGDVLGINYIRQKFIKDDLVLYLFSPLPEDKVYGDKSSPGYVTPYTVEIEGKLYGAVIKNKSELKRILKQVGYEGI